MQLDQIPEYFEKVRTNYGQLDIHTACSNMPDINRDVNTQLHDLKEMRGAMDNFLASDASFYQGLLWRRIKEGASKYSISDESDRQALVSCIAALDAIACLLYVAINTCEFDDAHTYLHYIMKQTPFYGEAKKREDIYKDLGGSQKVIQAEYSGALKDFKPIKRKSRKLKYFT